MKLVGRDIMDEAAAVLEPGDLLVLPPIFYAGGSADQSIASEDLAAHLNAKAGREAAVAVASKDAARDLVVAAARPGDVILSMGARDSALGAFARSLLDALGT